VLVLSALCLVVGDAVDVVVPLGALPSSDAGVSATFVTVPDGTVLFKQFPLSANEYAGSGVHPRGFLIA